MCFFSKKKKKKKITTESSPFFLTEKCIAAWGGMKVDFAWPTPIDNMVTYDRHMSPPPSSSCPQKIHLHHLPHLQTPKVTFRCASAALADPHTALPSSLFSVCLPCQAEKKKIYCMSAAKTLSSPSTPIVCTLTTTSILKHAWTHTLHTHSLTETHQVNQWKSESPNRCLNLLRLMFCVDLEW